MFPFICLFAQMQYIDSLIQRIDQQKGKEKAMLLPDISYYLSFIILIYLLKAAFISSKEYGFN